ncbi:hypothetical protein II906_05120 [bacterium]|nr:hypothetical protein [bacterium]
MKKLLTIMSLMIFACCTSAQEVCNSTKCIDLMNSMYNRRAALYNVLNLTKEQQIYKDEIDKKYQNLLFQMNEELNKEKHALQNMQKYETSNETLNRQKNIIKNIENDMKCLNKQYDKELKAKLNKEQINKLKTIRKVEKRALKHCQRDKALYKHDKNVRIFGEPY